MLSRKPGIAGNVATLTHRTENNQLMAGEKVRIIRRHNFDPAYVRVEPYAVEAPLGCGNPQDWVLQEHLKVEPVQSSRHGRLADVCNALWKSRLCLPACYQLRCRGSMDYPEAKLARLEAHTLPVDVRTGEEDFHDMIGRGGEYLLVRSGEEYLAEAFASIQKGAYIARSLSVLPGFPGHDEVMDRLLMLIAVIAHLQNVPAFLSLWEGHECLERAAKLGYTETSREDPYYRNRNARVWMEKIPGEQEANRFIKEMGGNE